MMCVAARLCQMVVVSTHSLTLNPSSEDLSASTNGMTWGIYSQRSRKLRTLQSFDTTSPTIIGNKMWNRTCRIVHSCWIVHKCFFIGIPFNLDREIVIIYCTIYNSMKHLENSITKHVKLRRNRVAKGAAAFGCFYTELPTCNQLSTKITFSVCTCMRRQHSARAHTPTHKHRRKHTHTHTFQYAHFDSVRTEAN